MQSATNGAHRSFLVFITLVISISAASALGAFGVRSNWHGSRAASLNIVIAVVQDGIATLNTTTDTMNTIAVCPSDPTPGCDFSATNGIVRTNDSILYSYDYSVNGLSEDVTVTATAPLGTTWNVLPAFCLAGSSINAGNGTTVASVITCNRGIQVAGTAESLPFTATVLGGTGNGTRLNATGSVSGPASSIANASAPNVFVSAAPRFNLRKVYQTVSPATQGGAPGYRIEYRAILEVYDDSTPAAFNPRYGSEALASPLAFTDVVSAVSPNAVVQGCGKQNDHGGNGGTASCTQTGGAGQNITVTITGANTSLSQWATPPADGRFLIGTYQILVWIPDTDVLNASGQSLATTNTLTSFDPSSVSGQSNFGAGTERANDNFVTRNFTPLTGSFGNAFVKDYNSGSTTAYGVLVGSTRFVGPGDIFAAQLSLNNNTGAPLTDVYMCDVMDNSRYGVAETAPGSGVVHGNDSPAPISIEYAAGYVNPNWQPTASGGAPANIRTECNDAGVTWYSSPTAVPGGLAAITKFRARYTTLAAGAVATVRVRVQARENNYYTGQTNFNGSSLNTYGIWRSNELNTTYSNNTFYAPAYPAGTNGSPGSRLVLARAIARIVKETESNDSVNSVATGGTIGYVLKPVLSNLGPANPVQVTVKDVMPAGLSYIVGTGMQNGSSFEPQLINCTAAAVPDANCPAANRQLLVWTLNNRTPNVAIPPISFRAAADLTVLNNQTVTNTAIISAPADATTESLRTATRNVIGASPSTLLIFKTSNTSQIEVNAPFRYTVSYRNASISNDFTGLDFIDVLPFNGDASLPFDLNMHSRTPASSFAGTSTLASLSATTGGASWYFTNAIPSTINISPKFSTNLAPGGAGSIWCAGTAAGPAAGCGFTLAQTTAVRMIDNVLMPRSTAVRSFTLNFASAGNQANNRYTNNSTGSAAELALAISSNNIPVVVLESSISGTVWYDTNGDGIRGVEEIGRVDGVTVSLAGTDSLGAQVNRSATTSGGAYSFAQIPSGTYTVTFSRPSGYLAGTRDNGSDDSIDSDGDETTLATAPMTLGVNQARSGVDQGYYRTELGGTVWRDYNENGTADGGEPGLGGLTVELLNNSASVVGTTSTDPNGAFLFGDLSSGNYRVRITRGSFIRSPTANSNADDNVDGDNNGGTMTAAYVETGGINLSAGNEPTLLHATGTTRNNTLDIGLTLPPSSSDVTIGGRVTMASGRGVPRAMLTLTGPDGSVRYAIANSFGYYKFREVPGAALVVVMVRAKNRVFRQESVMLTTLGDMPGIDFVSQ